MLRAFCGGPPRKLQKTTNGENYVGAMNSTAYSDVQCVGQTGRFFMVRKFVTIALIGGGLMMAACNTVRGAGEDVQSVANCTENAINNGNC